MKTEASLTALHPNPSRFWQPLWLFGRKAACTLALGLCGLVTPSLAQTNYYWDGSNTSYNGSADGGSGTWNTSLTNWTNPGISNNFAWPTSGAGYAAVFPTVGGTVTIPSAVSMDLMRFNADGYTLTGTGSLSFPGTSLGIQVRPNNLAVINVPINGSGSGGLILSDTGTLRLGATNGYTGPTTINFGTLSLSGSGTISSTSGVSIDSGATFDFNRSTNLSFGKNISGQGNVTHSGSGTTTLTGSNTYSGTTTIKAGTLAHANNASAFGTSTIQVDATGTLSLFTSGGSAGGGLNLQTLANPVQGPGAVNYSGSSYNDLSFTGSWAGFSGNLTVAGSGAQIKIVNPASANMVLSVNAGNLVALYPGTTTAQTVNVGELNGAGTIFSGTGTATVTLSVGGRNTSTTYAGTIIDAFSTGNKVALTKVGSGTLTLSNASTYTGATTVNNGILAFAGAGSSSATAPILVNSGGTLRLDRTSTWGVYSTAGHSALTVNGGTLSSNSTFTTLTNPTLTNGATVNLDGGANADFGAFAFKGTVSSSGNTSVNAGTGTNNFIGIGNNVANGVTTFDVISGTMDTGVVLNDSRNSANTAFVASGLTKTGAGLLRFTAANTYTGATTVSGGTLSLGGTAGNLSGTSSVNLSAAGATLDFNRSNNLSFGNVITGPGNVTHSGAGTTTLTATNNYSGSTAVNVGTLIVGNGATAGSINTSSGVSIAANATLSLRRSDNTTPFKTSAPAATVSGAGTLAHDGSGTSTMVFTGTATPLANLTGPIEVNQGTLRLSTASNLSSASYGGTNITVGSGARLEFVGSAGGDRLNLSAGTNINFAASGNATVDASTLTLVPLGALTFKSQGGARNTFSGSSGLNLNTSPNTITFDVATGSDTNGVDLLVSTPLWNSGNIVKTGAGRLQLTANNTYTGTTSVNAGRLNINGNQSSATGGVTVANNATLGGTGTVGGATTVQSGGKLEPGTSPGTLTFSNGLTLSAGSITTFELAGPSTTCGNGGASDCVAVTGGTLSIDATASTGAKLVITPLSGFAVGTYTLFTHSGLSGTFDASNITLPAGYVGTINTSTTGQVRLVVTAAAQSYWDGSNTTFNNTVDGGTSTWDASTTNWTTSNGSVNYSWPGGTGVAVFQGTPGTVTVSGTQSAGGLTFNTSGYSLTGGTINLAGTTNTITGSSGSQSIASTLSGGAGNAVVFEGSGTTTLTLIPAYTGDTTVNAGTLQLKLTTSGMQTSSSSILNNANVVLDLTNAASAQWFLTGSVAGSGTWTVDSPTAENQFTRRVLLAPAAGKSVTTSGTWQVNNRGKLWLIPSPSGSINTTSTVSLNGALSRLTLGGATANTVSTIGVLTGIGFVDIVDPAGQPQTLAIGNGGGSGNFSGVIRDLSLTLSLNKEGTGTQTLSGTNTYTGATTVNAGTLSLGGTAGDLSGTSGVNVATAGATLDFNRSNAYSFGKTITGPGKLTHSGAGTTTLTAANTYTGTTTVNVGRLNINGNQSAANGAVTVANGGTLGGTGIVGGATTVQSGGKLEPGTSPGTLTFGSGLTLSAGSITTLELGAPSTTCGNSGASDCVAVTGNLSIDATASTGAKLVITPLSGFSAGTYTLMTYSGGSLSGTFDMSNVTLPNGYSGTIDTSTPGQVRLVLGLSISGHIFNDGGLGSGTANNGVKDGTEPGVGGVVVNLTNCSSSTLATASTDGSGAYSLQVPLASLGATVCLEPVLPATHLATGANVGGTPIPQGSPTTVGGVSYSYTRSPDRLSFTAPSGGGALAISFGRVPVSTLISDSTRTAAPGMFATHGHRFTAGTAGMVSLSTLAATTVPATVTGWNESFYADTGCTGSLQPGAAAITAPVAVTQGQVLCFVMREFVPAGAQNGNSNSVPVQASLAFSNANPALTVSYKVTDATTVSNAVVTLLKEVRNLTTGGSWGTSNSAKTGDELEYRVTFTNTSAAPVTNVVIQDGTTAWTTWKSATATTVPSGLTCALKTPANPSVAQACSPAVTGSGKGSLTWTFTGSLQPTASGVVTFKVVVD